MGGDGTFIFYQKAMEQVELGCLIMIHYSRRNIYIFVPLSHRELKYISHPNLEYLLHVKMRSLIPRSTKRLQLDITHTQKLDFGLCPSICYNPDMILYLSSSILAWCQDIEITLCAYVIRFNSIKSNRN